MSGRYDSWASSQSRAWTNTSRSVERSPAKALGRRKGASAPAATAISRYRGLSVLTSTRSTLRAARACSTLWTSRGLPRKEHDVLSGMLREPAARGHDGEDAHEHHPHVADPARGRAPRPARSGPSAFVVGSRVKAGTRARRTRIASSSSRLLDGLTRARQAGRPAACGSASGRRMRRSFACRIGSASSASSTRLSCSFSPGLEADDPDLDVLARLVPVEADEVVGDVEDADRLPHVEEVDLAALGDAGGLEDEAAGLGDGHEEAGGARVRHRDRPSPARSARGRGAATLPFEPSTLPKRTAAKRVATRARATARGLGRALRRAHDAGGRHRLVRGDEGEVLDPVLAGRGRRGGRWPRLFVAIASSGCTSHMATCLRAAAWRMTSGFSARSSSSMRRGGRGRRRAPGLARAPRVARAWRWIS